MDTIVFTVNKLGSGHKLELRTDAFQASGFSYLLDGLLQPATRCGLMCEALTGGSGYINGSFSQLRDPWFLMEASGGLVVLPRHGKDGPYLE